MEEPTEFQSVQENLTFPFWNRFARIQWVRSPLRFVVKVYKLLLSVFRRFVTFSVFLGLILGLSLPFSYVMESLSLTISASTRIYFLISIALLSAFRLIIARRAHHAGFVSRLPQFRAIQATVSGFSKLRSTIASDLDKRQKLIEKRFRQYRQWFSEPKPQTSGGSATAAAAAGKSDRTTSDDYANERSHANPKDSGESQNCASVNIHSIYFDM